MRADLKNIVFFIIIISLITLIFINCQSIKKPQKKQIILISLDTLRGDHLSSYGYFRNTSPNLDKLIKDSMYFKNAYPNGCWTMPSHMSLLTGTLPSRHGINQAWRAKKDYEYRNLNESIKCIAEIFQKYKIKTIKFAKLPDGFGFGRGFDKNNKIDPFNPKNFNRLLNELEINKDNDFFLFIHTWQVHAPYNHSHFLPENKISPEKRNILENFGKHKTVGKNPQIDFRKFLRRNKLFNVKDCVALYDSGILYVDHYIGRIVDTIKKLDIYDNVLFIVVSDHGENFSDHYKWRFYDDHGKDFYEEFVKIPIIIKLPFSAKSKSVDEPVSLIDVLPTILDYYEIDIPGLVQGKSLLRVNFRKEKKYLISEAISLPKRERKMILFENFKYIITMTNPVYPGRLNFDSIVKRRLFDMKKDPLEKNNLYPNLKYRPLCVKLEKILLETIKSSIKPVSFSKKTKLKRETIKLLESLGYL